MKIDDISHDMNHVGNLETSNNKQTGGGKKPPSISEGVSQLGAKVDLSTASVEFSRAAKKMDEVPEERAQKIEDLKVKVQNDTYNVDSMKIAEKIIKDALSNIIGPQDNMPE
jgi:flagellar biosynthesis anti-sigma factor FlgM